MLNEEVGVKVHSSVAGCAHASNACKNWRRLMQCACA